MREAREQHPYEAPRTEAMHAHPAASQSVRQEPIYMFSAGNGIATAALVLGLIGVIFGLVPIGAFVAAVCAILAVVFGMIGRRRARDPRIGGRGRATAGLVLGLIGIVMSVIGMAIITRGALDLDRNLDQIDREFQQEMRQLEEDFEVGQ